MWLGTDPLFDDLDPAEGVARGLVDVAGKTRVEVNCGGIEVLANGVVDEEVVLDDAVDVVEVEEEVEAEAEDEDGVVDVLAVVDVDDGADWDVDGVADVVGVVAVVVVWAGVLFDVDEVVGDVAVREVDGDEVAIVKVNDD